MRQRVKIHDLYAAAYAGIVQHAPQPVRRILGRIPLVEGHWSTAIRSTAVGVRISHRGRADSRQTIWVVLKFLVDRGAGNIVKPVIGGEVIKRQPAAKCRNFTIGG